MSAAGLPGVRGHLLNGHPSRSQSLVHDMEPHAAKPGMFKGLRHSTDHVEAECCPESYGDVVGLHDGVELHGGVALSAGPGERVLAEGMSDALPRASSATMKLAVETCEPLPGRLGPILADPSRCVLSTATTVWPGGVSTHTFSAC